MARKMKDSGIEWIGEIPEGWETQKLKYYATVTSGEILSRDEYDFSGDIPVIGSNGKIGTTYKSNNHSEVITTGRVGTIGTAQIVQDAWITDNALIIKSHSINRPFLTYVIPNFDFKFMLSGTAQPLITATKLKNQYIPVPSSEVQDKLVQYLNTQIFNLSHLISQACSSIELYKKLKQAVITQAVTKGVRGERAMKDSGVEWIGEIPKEWGRTKIKMIASFFNGDRTSRYPQPTDFVDDGIAFLTSRNIDGDEVDLSETKYITKSKYNSLSGAKIQIDDIIFCLRGSVGKCAINRTLSCGTVASSLATIRPKDIHPKYLLYFLLSNVASIQTAVFMNGTCAANLSAENVANYYITLPRSTEQKEIADYLDAKCAEIDGLIAKKEQLVKELESYKKSLIYEVVTGKREV